MTFWPQAKATLLALAAAQTFWIAKVDARQFEPRVLSSIGTAAPDPREKLVASGTPVTLHLAVQLDGRLFAAVPKVVWTRGGRAVPATEAGDGWSVRWYKVEVESKALSNTDPSFHWEPIGYRDVELPSCRNQWSCAADVRATLLADRGGLGTMAFKVEVERDGQRAASTGAEKLFRGGLTEDVARVTVRRDDSYLGRLTELFNTPYIWGSAGEPASVHQAERRIGSDCADFVTYGVRRLGHSVPYTSTWALPEYAREVAASDGPDDQGVYRDARGEALTFGGTGAKTGDLLLFRGHVGALAKDEAPLGVLSTSDLMLHTCWAEPVEESLAASGYGARPLRVMRWRVFER